MHKWEVALKYVLYVRIFLHEIAPQQPGTTISTYFIASLHFHFLGADKFINQGFFFSGNSPGATPPPKW